MNEKLQEAFRTDTTVDQMVRLGCSKEEIILELTKEKKRLTDELMRLARAGHCLTLPIGENSLDE